MVHAESHIPELSHLRRASNTARKALASGAPFIDEDIAELIKAINVRSDVCSVCSCSGIHAGALSAYVVIAPRENTARSIGAFSRFKGALNARIAEAGYVDIIHVRSDSGFSAGVHIVDKGRLKQLWAWLTECVNTISPPDPQSGGSNSEHPSTG
jgi:hypothetical protein